MIANGYCQVKRFGSIPAAIASMPLITVDLMARTLDGVILSPTVVVGGKTILDKGKLLDLACVIKLPE